MSIYDFSPEEEAPAPSRQHFQPCLNLPFDQTNRKMSADEVIYHLKKHRGSVYLHFLLGPSDPTDTAPTIPARAQFARDQVCRFVESYATKCEMYCFIYKGVMHVTPIRPFGTFQMQQPQEMVAAPNPEAPISALLTEFASPTNQARLLQYTLEDDPRGPFVDLTVHDREYLESENCYAAKLKEQADTNDFDYAYSFLVADQFYMEFGYYPKGWNRNWPVPADWANDPNQLKQLIVYRKLGRAKEAARIGLANLPVDSLGVTIEEESLDANAYSRTVVPRKGNNVPVAQGSAVNFKVLTQEEFDALSDEGQEIYGQAEDEYYRNNPHLERPNFY